MRKYPVRFGSFKSILSQNMILIKTEIDRTNTMLKQNFKNHEFDKNLFCPLNKVWNIYRNSSHQEGKRSKLNIIRQTENKKEHISSEKD